MINSILTWIIATTLITIAITLMIMASILSELHSHLKWKPAYDTQMQLLHKSHLTLLRRVIDVEKKVDSKKCLLEVRRHGKDHT